ncbi:hypothetical protein CBL_09655 [Carabus blaptoides fortunei]
MVHTNSIIKTETVNKQHGKTRGCCRVVLRTDVCGQYTIFWSTLIQWPIATPWATHIPWPTATPWPTTLLPYGPITMRPLSHDATSMRSIPILVSTAEHAVSVPKPQQQQLSPIPSGARL